MHKALLPVLPIVAPGLVLGTTTSVEHSAETEPDMEKIKNTPSTAPIAAESRAEDEVNNFRGMPLRRITPIVPQYFQSPTVYHPAVEAATTHVPSPYAGYRLVAHHPMPTKQPLSSFMYPAVPHPALTPMPMRSKFNPNAKEFVPGGTMRSQACESHLTESEAASQQRARYTLEVETTAQTQTWNILQEQQTVEYPRPTVGGAASPFSPEDQERLRHMLNSLKGPESA